MRLGTFLMGGIVGAIAVSYINRNNGTMMASLANAGQNMGSMVTKAKSSFSNNMNTDMSSNVRRNDSNNDKSSDHAELSRVKEILSKDPDLKTKVDEILAENQNTASAYKVQ